MARRGKKGVEIFKNPFSCPVDYDSIMSAGPKILQGANRYKFVTAGRVE